MVAGLAEAVRKLMLKQSRARCESSGDCLNGWKALLGRRLQACKVLEGEEGAEAASEGFGFGGEDLAEGEDCLVDVGDLGRERHCVSRGREFNSKMVKWFREGFESAIFLILS